MIWAGKVAPAVLRRAFSVFTALVTCSMATAAVPAGSLPDLAQVGKPNAEQASRLIEQFRNSGIPGDYFLEFELVAMPRRGEERTFKGKWWGSRNNEGAITRVELTDGTGNAHRLLIQNGASPKVWRFTSGRVAEVGVADLMAPLIPGVEISAFDLQMPYLYWPGATVEKITRVLGRPSNEFLFPAPAAFKAQYSEIGAARAYLDTQFNVPTKTEVIGSNGKVTKTLTLLNLQTVNNQTIFKSADYRNEVTRDKTRLQVTGVALNLTPVKTLFEPASLALLAAPPPSASVVRVNP